MTGRGVGWRGGAGYTLAAIGDGEGAVLDPQAQTTFFGKWQVVARGGRFAWWRSISPPQFFIGSFVLLVVGGMLGLKLLPGLYVGEELSWLDALFTSTSAVCVTGLIVVDTATYFTPLGQAFILLLIQIGGLGIIAFTSLIIVALGRRLSLRHEALSSGVAEVAPHVSRRHLVRDVVFFTFAIELLGAIALFLLWSPQASERGVEAVAWDAIFHSVSAFCNAGFSTYSDSLTGYQRSPLTLLVVMTLIVVGGIGFLTLEELYLRYRAGQSERIFRVSVHTRVVLLVTGVLIVGGWVLFSIFEWNHTLVAMPWWAKLTNSLFLSVTPRTAGFNTIDYGQATSGTNFLTILLMSVGGSPGSTAGGLKTTTVALIGLLAWSRLRGHRVPSIWGRSLPDETIQRAVGLFVIMFGMVTGSVFVLTTTEHALDVKFDFLTYMFEAVSAFNTVGLSMGVTPELTSPGKITTITLMFLGRVGPLTLAAAIARRPGRAGREFRYAYEDVVVG